MSLLDSILSNKRRETEQRKVQAMVPVLEKQDHFNRQCHSLIGCLCAPNARLGAIRETSGAKVSGPSGIIAEFKRRSPSRGPFAEKADIKDVAKGYQSAGASAISVLTDNKYFGGSTDDLLVVRSMVDIPVLRKDFLVEEYQVVESKSAGADAILLIVRLLTPIELLRLAQLSHRLGMEVLIEVHTEEEIHPAIDAGADLIGINHRDLDTLTIDLSLSERLGPLVPHGTPCVAESGLHSAETIRRLTGLGFRGFLIGDYFMRDPDPAKRCKDLINQLRHES
jgi:indole-3-glycerol phosphate synthase